MLQLRLSHRTYTPVCPCNISLFLFSSIILRLLCSRSNLIQFQPFYFCYYMLTIHRHIHYIILYIRHIIDLTICMIIAAKQNNSLMKAPPRFLVDLLSCFLLLLISTQTSSAQLTRDFYRNICPNVEQIVRSAVAEKFLQTFVTAPATLRLYFHDCFVRGCDASILLASPNSQAEKDHPDDISLAGDGFDTVVKAKAAVDSNPQCKNKVSCADILALATRDVINLSGGPSYEVELGRRDGTISTIASVQRRLPHPEFDLDQLNSMFNFNGLSQTDMIALSGAHTIGFSHCNRFSKRIYNFSPINKIDPTLNLQYALQLRQACPLRVDPRIAINMDPTTPQTFDNQYFKNLQQGKGLFTSDQVLATDARSKNTVNLFASNKSAFESAFIDGITKMGRIGVKTGNQGQIRVDCSRVN
ncbi:putative peroxidase [Lupinus albus]|uniref:Peroxidase n=1 Tax=Lupinus albus TaxID=3870 RepID=A0A6A4NQ77_LUPAL|nr:putative peroxidase [Lupinus albus]